MYVNLLDKLKHTSHSNVFLWILCNAWPGHGREMRRGPQFWHPPLDGSTTQSWVIGLARKTEHVHVYINETPAGISMTSTTSAVHEKGPECRWYCSVMEVCICTQICVSFTNTTRDKEAERVEISLLGALHDSSFHIWMFSSLCSVPVAVPEGRMSPISNPILGLPI